MLFVDLLRILWAPFLIQLFVSVFFFTATWWSVTRFYPVAPFRWAAPALLGFIFSLGWSSYKMVGLYEGKLISDAQQLAQQQAREIQQQREKEYMQLKAEFLKSLETIAKNPSSLSEETKKKVFEQFKSILGEGQTRMQVANSVFTAYSCQKFFLQDALASFKARKIIKSKDLQACESYDGSFFGREKLLPPDVVKNNDEALRLIAARERLPASNGKTEEVTETDLKAKFEAQSQAVETIRTLFQ